MDRFFVDASCTLRRVPGANSRRRTRKEDSRFAWLRGAPPWMSALAAVFGTILTAVAVFGLVDRAGQHVPTPAPTVATTPATGRVTLESVLVGPQQVEAQGAFEFVDPEREEILFIGRPSGQTSELWVAVEAALSPASQAGSLVSGQWTAVRPAPPPSAVYRWRAILWPAASGATGQEDLQLNGPDSEFVIASSEEWISE